MRKSGTMGKRSNIPFNPKQYIKEGMMSEEIQAIKDAFDLFDPEGTGFVEPKDLKVALNSLGHDAKNQPLFLMIADLEDQGNVSLDFEDFLNLITARVSQRQTKRNIHNLFNLFDDDKTGYISIKNLRKVVKDLAESIDDHDLQQMIDRADLDRDGLVSQDEFYMILTKKF